MNNHQHSGHKQQAEHKNHLTHEMNKPGKQTDQQKYTCPMHPEVISDKPGNCPKCGMTLVPVKDKPKHEKVDHTIHNTNSPMGHAGHDHHAMMIDDFKKRFYIVLILTVPIMLLSEMIQHWLNIYFSFIGSQYVLLVLSSVVFFYGGFTFLKGLVDEVKARNLGMMTLIGFAITVAYVYSVATVFGLKGMGFFLGAFNTYSDNAF